MAGTEVVREGDNDNDAHYRFDNLRASKELLEAIKGHNGLHKEEAKDAADWCPWGILAGQPRIRESREERGSALHYQCQGRCVDNDTQTAIKEKCEAIEKRMGEASTRRSGRRRGWSTRNGTRRGAGTRTSTRGSEGRRAARKSGTRCNSQRGG